MRAPASYDDNQMNTTLRTCPKCERPFYMPPGRVICVSCSSGKRAVKPNSFQDTQGNPMLWGD